MVLGTFRRKKLPTYRGAEIDALRRASRFNAELMDFIRPYVRPGVKTRELDKLVHDYTRDHGHVPACLGYKGYPNCTCISINEVVCHGIPDDRELRDGDIANIDLTTIVDDWYGDQSETFLVGNVTPHARYLVQATHDALFAGINAIKPFGTVFDIGRAIVRFAEPLGYGVVREYQGHGIGRNFHQEPGVPHFPHPQSRKDVITPGVCFTIEPMLNAGGWQTTLDDRDGWTVRTADRSLSAQFEHTILMTESGPEILTMTEHGPQEGHDFCADM